MDALPADAVLLADIGGTNARFALADCKARRPLLGDSVRKYAVADFGSLVDAARHYLQATSARPARGVFSVAGPVLGDEVRMTNHRWVVDIGATRDALGLRALDVVNDFAAQAMAVELLGEDDVCVIGTPPWRPQPARDGPRVIVGPGTGLGVGALAIRDGRAIAVTTEAGHVGFAPTDALQVALLQALARRFGRVSNERLVSGAGLVNLHAALGENEGASAADFPVAEPADVTAGAASGDPRCRRAIAVFCAVFGAVAGDMALAFAAWDGVFLSGGVVPHVLDALRGPDFRAAFEAKGRYAAPLAAVPTLAVVHPQPGLVGAAAIARAREPAREGGVA